ncbi:hypothetical protein AGMMS49992_21400 [Clostridia bacterium]|nr:hypothetical protein AGMMS49992_21400 [Clostridia bacterium]
MKGKIPMNLTPLICIVASVVMLTLTGFLLPLIRRKLTAEQHKDFDRILDILIQAAEQMYGSGLGSVKLESVKSWLIERGYEIDIEAIEAAVRRLHADGYSI